MVRLYKFPYRPQILYSKEELVKLVRDIIQEKASIDPSGREKKAENIKYI